MPKIWPRERGSLAAVAGALLALGLASISLLLADGAVAVSIAFALGSAILALSAGAAGFYALHRSRLYRIEAAARGDRQFRATFEEAAVGLAHVAPDGRWLRVNDQFSVITGYSREELLGGSFQEITHPDDLAADMQHVVALLAGSASRYAMEKRYVRKNGEPVWVNLTATLIRDAQGRPDYFVSVIEDIGARRRAVAGLAESEARHRAIFDTAAEAIVVLDSDGTIQSVNPAAERIFGYTDHELVGRNIQLLLPAMADDAGDHAAGIDGEVEGRRKDGSAVALDLSRAQWLEGERTLSTAIMRDIGPHRAAENALRASEERLRALQNEFAHLARVNELSEMAAAISHEINQPLTAIVNYLNAGLYATAEGLSPENFAEAREVMTEAAAQALRAGGIVRRLREFIGKGGDDRAVEELDTLVDAASGFALIDARANGIVVERVTRANGARIRADHVQIQQVVVNLVRNAVDALVALPPHRKRRLTITTAHLPQERAVEVRIADSGCGVAPDLRSSLFEPFITTKAQGIGMGLPVCRRLLEAHGGTITLEDTAEGASFVVRLPEAEPDPEPS